MRSILPAAVIAIAFATPAQADFTGNTLKDACDSPSQTAGSGMCFGYIAGTLDSFREINRLRLEKPWFCEPPDVTGEQIVAMVRKFLADHPEKLHLQAASLISAMMANTFPCPAKP